jgi:hypothetical protein
MSRPLEPWDIDDSAFPFAGPFARQLGFLVEYAVLAPSGHNTQPWRFRIRGETVEILADRTRRLPVVDPDDRELVISCGAALLHLRLAMEHFGFEPNIDVLPDATDPDVLVRVSMGQPVARPDDNTLFAAIKTRRCHRLTFEDRPVDSATRVAFASAASVEGARLDFAEHGARRRLAELIVAGGIEQGNNPAFCKELASWVRPNTTQRHDGIPGYAFGVPTVASFLSRFAVKRLGVVKRQATKKDRDAALHAPLLAVLSTNSDTPYDWLIAGQAIARVLLTARALNIWAAFMNMPIEVTELRPRVAEALGHSTHAPQLLLRMGYGDSVRATPRRSAEEVIVD